MEKLIFFAAFFCISGCSSTQYSCGESPQSGQCQSLSSVYNRTDGELYDYRNSKSKTDMLNFSSEHKHTVNFEHEGKTPLLSKPRVLRIFFNPFEDSDKDLNLGGYVYIRLSESEWQITN